MTDLVFPDQQGYADLATLVRRARQADPDAAVRLQVTGAVLRVWVGVLPGTGLLADGAAVGVRGIELANEDAGGSASEAGALDLVCASAALSDRFAYDGVGASRLSVPPASTYAAWAGALPAAAGWSSIGALSAQALIDALSTRQQLMTPRSPQGSTTGPSTVPMTSGEPGLRASPQGRHSRHTCSGSFRSRARRCGYGEAGAGFGYRLRWGTSSPDREVSDAQRAAETIPSAPKAASPIHTMTKPRWAPVVCQIPNAAVAAAMPTTVPSTSASCNAADARPCSWSGLSSRTSPDSVVDPRPMPNPPTATAAAKVHTGAWPRVRPTNAAHPTASRDAPKTTKPVRSSMPDRRERPCAQDPALQPSEPAARTSPAEVASSPFSWVSMSGR